MGQWGLKPSRRDGGVSYEELVEEHGRPRLRMWLERARAEGLLEAAVVYGYFRCVSEGNDLIVLDDDAEGAGALHVPAAAAGPAAVPGRLLRLPRIRPDRRGGVPARHHGIAGQRGHRRAVREELLPRLPRAARPVRAAHRGARRVLARPDPARAGRRRRRTRPASRTSSGWATGAPGTRSAIRPARTSPTGPRWPGCCGPSDIGVELTEEMQLVPEQSTDALVVHHPEAKYFST